MGVTWGLAPKGDRGRRLQVPGTMGWLGQSPRWQGSGPVRLALLVCLLSKPTTGSDDIELLGKGACRGAGWQDGIWPLDEGRKTTKECAATCKDTKGCVAFDLSNKEGEKYDCLLLGHPNIFPASALKAECYRIKGAEVDPETRKPLPPKQTATPAKKAGGKDPRWEDPATRPAAEGATRKAKPNAAKPSGSDPRWQDPTVREPAAGETKKPDRPTSKQGAKDSRWEDPSTREPAAGETKKAKKPAAAQGVKDPRWEDPSTREPAAGEMKSAKTVKPGEQGVKDSRWEDPSTREPAAGEMKKAASSKKSGVKDPRWEDPATRPRAAGERSGPPSPSRKIDDVYPAGGAGYARLGSGRCRGSGWQIGKWPEDKGSKTAAECASSCQKSGGCKAFDLASGEGKKFACTLYGHESIVPTGYSASMAGVCYSISDSLAEEEEEVEEVAGEEEDMIIDLEGDVDIALLGKGGCRGGGWQDKDWPQLKGFLSLDNCGKECVKTDGCTAFHAAGAKEGDSDKFECFLFGHKSVIAARGLVGNCYTVSKGTAKTIRSKAPSAAPKAAKKKKVYKIPEFEEPKVVEDEFEEDDDEWLFEPPPPEIRSRDHIIQTLGLNEPAHDGVLKVTETTLKELKKVYENSIKDLEKTYKYKELSHRHFGDPEMFNKPLIVLMGPWSGGKSTMINYLLGNEYSKDAFKTSAEPSTGFNFNIAMYGEHSEEMEGTEIAAEWAFSSLQKFGQEFLKKLKGKKMPNKLLEKATFAEIPGVLETGTIRKIDRRYPFNDACQWFIDHADLIVLVYDYAKLDIGPETEALLDQLKGRESQVRIILNKADEITAEELLKIQGNLVWNVSPLMASMEPPTLYAGSFWSHPYKEQAPKKLLKAQERSLLKDIREAIDKRVINRIATARRFAVRVRNHAKMVDCYLTTYNNKKGRFGNKKIEDDIVQHPEKYNIYEGISAMTNISRYDLPDPETYKVFFALHPLPDFKTLQQTCKYFKECPINKLDQAIAYDLPEALTAYKRETAGTPKK